MLRREGESMRMLRNELEAPRSLHVRLGDDDRAGRQHGAFGLPTSSGLLLVRGLTLEQPGALRPEARALSCLDS